MEKENQSLLTYLSLWGTIIGNTVIILTLAISAYIHSNHTDLYHSYLQEDGFLEWASFWAFFIAGVIYAGKAKNLYRKSGFKWSWFIAGLSIFCFLVAMEEISWGQRLLGYQPPEYFLKQNFQQEFNFHNIIDTSIRKIGLKVIILGFGVFFPLLVSFDKIKSILKKIGVIAPPLLLAPSFLITFLLYQIYPFKFTGEIVELMLGLGFMFSSVAFFPINDNRFFLSRPIDVKSILISTVLVIVLGFTNYFISKNIKNDDPAMISTTETEIKALQKDFVNLVTGKFNNPIPPCGRHKRVYAYFGGNKKSENIFTKNFTALLSQGLPEERAAFYIDPWNSPYWVRDLCSPDGRRLISIYSFGPDRQRQSEVSEIKGDDIGIIEIVN